MLTLQDCLDYCDLTDEEVALFAEHTHIPCETATPMVCGLVQSDEGVALVEACLSELVSEALRCGEFDKAEHVLSVFAQFHLSHPLTH